MQAAISIRNIGALALALLVSVGCAKTAFTQAVRDRYDLSADDTKRIQFSTSEEIVLQREVAVQARGSQGPALSIQDGVRIDQVVIPAHTPCVAIEVHPDWMLVSFARREAGRTLWFAMSNEAIPPPPPEARTYDLVALENEAGEAAPFSPRWSKGFLFGWGGHRYRVVRGRAAHLDYVLDESFSTEKTKQQPPGWRLSDGPAPPAPTAPPAPSAPSVPSAPSAPSVASPDAR